MTRAATKCLLIYGRFLNCTTAFDFSTYNPLQLQEKRDTYAPARKDNANEKKKTLNMLKKLE